MCVGRGTNEGWSRVPENLTEKQHLNKLRKTKQHMKIRESIQGYLNRLASKTRLQLHKTKCCSQSD
jgi:hypothetical protein